MRILDLAEETGIKKEHTMYYSKDFEGIRTGYELAGNRFSEIRKEKLSRKNKFSKSFFILKLQRKTAGVIHRRKGGTG